MGNQADTSITHITELIKWPALGALIVSIAVGNTMTIIVQYLLSNRRFGGLPNQLIFNLAVADLFNGLALLIFTVQPQDFSHFSNYIRKIWCIVPEILGYAGCTASFYSIGAIALDRYVAILHPFKHQKYVTKWSISATIAVIWCITALISTGPIYWINTDIQSNCYNYSAEISYYDKYIFIPNVMIVWLVLLIAYWRILSATRAYTKRSRTRSKEVGQISNISNRKSNLAVTTILGCFSICWLPYMVVQLLAAFNLYKNNDVLFFAIFVGLCSSSINPIIYAWGSSAVREAYRRLFRQNTRNNNHNAPFENNLNQRIKSKESNELILDTVVTLNTVSTKVDLKVVGHGL